MDNTTMGYIIALVAGLFMAAYPKFVLFRPNRKGQWLYNILGEKRWTMMIRAFGIMFVIVMGYWLLIPLK